MAVIASNIVIGKIEKPIEEKPVQKSVLSSLNEIKRNPEPQPIVRKKEKVVIEKRAKLTDTKVDRKSAYVRDMTTVHKI